MNRMISAIHTLIKYASKGTMRSRHASCVMRRGSIVSMGVNKDMGKKVHAECAAMNNMRKYSFLSTRSPSYPHQRRGGIGELETMPRMLRENSQ